MTVYLILVFSSALSALCRVYYKISMRSANEVATVMAAQAVAALSCIPLLFLFFPTGPFDYLLLVLQGLLWTGFVYFEIRCLRHIDLGLSALLGSLDYLLQLLIGIFFFHEFLTEMKVAGAVFIIAGIVVSAQWRKPQVKAGMRFQLLASLCLVAVFPIDAILVKQLSPWFVGACAYVGPVLLLYLWRSEQRREALKLIRHSQALQLAGITNAASYLLILYLLTQWNFTDTVSGGQLMICFSLLFGRFLLNEKDNPYRRLLACGLIIVGIGLFRS